MVNSSSELTSTHSDDKITYKALSDRLDILELMPNNRAGFQWTVFSIGRTNKIQVDCNMNVRRVLTEVTPYPISDGQTTEATTTASAMATDKMTEEMTTPEQTTTALTTVQTTTLETQEKIGKF